MKKYPSRSDLVALLDYSPETGDFRWKVDKPPRAKAGNIAGHDNGRGYIIISINGSRYYAHRLAFIWMGENLPEEVDHKNHCRWDNRWENLVDLSHSANALAIPGISGVRERPEGWEARFRGASLGFFPTKKIAHAAFKESQILYLGYDPDIPRDKKQKKKAKPSQSGPKIEGKTLSEWSREIGVPQPTLHWRYRQGWTPDRILNRL